MLSLLSTAAPWDEAMRTSMVTADAEGTLEWSPRPEAEQLANVPVSSAGKLANRLVAGRYRVRTQLGRGGMGAVWLAHDDVLDRIVALKQLTNPQLSGASCALREARAAARIAHPGVVQVHDIVLDDHGEWIVMEALTGLPLSTIIRARGRLAVAEVTRVGLELLSAVQAIHEADLVHRDIKPSNVQVCRDGRIVLLDFGLSAPGGTCCDPGSGVVAGSLPYLAPETIIDGRVGPASDLYALGVTLYQAVEGRQPFDPAGELTMLDAVLTTTPMPGLHAGSLGAVLAGLLEKDPARRFGAGRTRHLLQALARA